MTDKEIIQGLIDRDNKVTEEFFFVKSRPLFLDIIRRVFSDEVDYDEFVNELYLYLMENDAVKLRRFEYRCSIYQWLKVVAIRFFIKKRDHLAEPGNQEPLTEASATLVADNADTLAKGDLLRLFSLMPNNRYGHVLKKLMVDGWEQEQLAIEMNITVDNLYNIKRRAMAQLTRVALNDIREYGK